MSIFFKAIFENVTKNWHKKIHRQNSHFSIKLRGMLNIKNNEDLSIFFNVIFENVTKNWHSHLRTYLFIISGRLLYETISTNMPEALPSLCAVQRFFQRKFSVRKEIPICKIKNIFRYKKLSQKKNMDMRRSNVNSQER